MNNATKNAAHWSFWIICGAAVSWNAMGGLNFIMQMNPDLHASYPAAARAIIEGRPLWATAGFAVAVFIGTFGCLLLLLRMPSAIIPLFVSLLGVLVTMAHTFMVAYTSRVGFTPLDISMMLVLPVMVAALLVWYACYARRKHWLR